MILKCKMCGGELSFEEGSSVCECEYCGSKQTIPNTDDEKLEKLYDRANRLRFNNEFDKAYSVYESIIAESPEDAEAYWGLVLCKYGIEYVDDPATSDKVPTCHRSSFDSVMDDENFELVMENADSIARAVYREQAKAIEEIRKGIIEVSGKEEPYDIFICYKETSESGERTIDSVLAQDVYDALTDKGYRVFYSRITLEDKLGREYEPYIFAALNSAKVMLAFGTSYDYYNAVWVKNEWSRYLKLMAQDKEKHLIPCYKDIDAYDMPKEFKHLQAQDMGKVGATQDLLRGIDKILHPRGIESTVDINDSVRQQDINEALATAMASNISNNVKALLERGFMSLEDEDYEEADGFFENVLNQNPKCAEAYMGKLMAYYNVTDVGNFAERLFNAFFPIEKKKIELGFDIQDLLENHYILSNKVSKKLIKRMKAVYNVSIETNIDNLNRFDKKLDYIKKYCSTGNGSSRNSKQGSKYYQRYLQYATDGILNSFDINNILQSIVEAAKANEEEKIHAIRNNSSKDSIVKIIETANEQAKSIVGHELDQIESEFQVELSEWQKKCDEITRDWPAKRQQILTDWQAQCDATKQQYEYDKNEADENNQRVNSLYQQAVSQYKSDIAEIHKQIGILNSELMSLGLFKIKQKDDVRNRIVALENSKSSLVEPVLENYGKLMPEPTLVMPEKPDDRKKPALPKKPVRKKLSQKVDADSILADEFEKKGIILVRKIVEFGAYKGTPITWIVLEKQDGKVLLLSECVLDGEPYYTDKAYDAGDYENVKVNETTWAQCTLRDWLNNNFINEAFGDEKNKICVTKVAATTNPEYDTNLGNDVCDKVFLLSIEEVNKYLTEDDERICYPTEYAEEFVYVNSFKEEGAIGATDWWLRSPGRNGNYAALVYSDGHVAICGEDIHEPEGVRPAMWVEL